MIIPSYSSSPTDIFSVLLFVLWYCHKRGKEVRLLKESIVDSEGRVVELDDDPLLGPADPSGSNAPATPSTQAAPVSNGKSNGKATSSESDVRNIANA